MFCSKCGNEINDGLKFCPKCGKSLTGEPEPVNQMYTKAPVSKNSKVIISAVAIIAVLIVGLVLVKVNSNIHKSPKAVVKAMFTAIDKNDVNKVIDCIGEDKSKLKDSDITTVKLGLKMLNTEFVKEYGSNWHSKIKIKEGSIKNNKCEVTITGPDGTDDSITVEKDPQKGWIIPDGLF